ncbi:MAG TPA: hypothetical protein VK945_07965 [Planococcus sp. (in: firmicutes)]|nr:hypothetical protein [Planococcus sp. (in: firmicutes)]
MNDALYINYGDIVATILLLGVPAILIFFIYRTFKLDKKRANERLELEKETTVILQKRIDELNDRVVVIEKMLREVD